MNIKVFISYVWESSSFADKLVNLIGRDIAVLDKYSFERASLLDEEIEEYLSKCPIVVSLFAAKSLDSHYIELELQIIQKLIKEGKIIHYKPFIVDESLDIGSIKRRYPWVLNYQLEKVRAPIFVDRIVDQFVTELKWEVNPALKARDNSVMVRLGDLAKIREKFYTINSAEKRALIISGFPNGIGRTKLLKEFLLGDICPNKPKTYSPPVLRLNNKDSIEEFIIFLNEWLLTYNEEQILDILSETKENKTLCAVTLMNELSEKTERVFVRDEGCIILPNGKLNSWIEGIINSTELTNQLHLFIASNHFLRNEEKEKNNKVINIVIPPLEKREKTILFNSYTNSRSISLSTEKESDFLVKLPGVPEIIFNFLDLIKDESIDYAENNIDKVIKSGDEKIKLFLSQFTSRDYVSLLVLLSSFPNITFKILEEISIGIIEDVDQKLQDLYCYSIIERYGSMNQYIAVNNAISDYLDRYKINFESGASGLLLKQNLVSYFEKLEKDDSFNLTGFVYDTENQIRLNIKGVKPKFLIPSIVLKLIRDKYKQGNDSEVIALCKRFLETRSSNSFIEVIREVKFWMCQSMARSTSNEFFDWINEFSDASKHFLLGFYFRYDRSNSVNLNKAKNNYEKALGYAERNSHSFRMANRIRQELVIILQKMGLYNEALELSKDNYESFPTNTYYIVAYFRSLVRNKLKHKSISILEKLLNELRNSFDPMKDAFVAILEGEFEYYINGNFQKSLEILERGIIYNPHKKISIHSSISEICKTQEAEPLAENIRKKYNIKPNDIEEKIQEE